MHQNGTKISEHCRTKHEGTQKFPNNNLYVYLSVSTLFFLDDVYHLLSLIKKESLNIIINNIMGWKYHRSTESYFLFFYFARVLLFSSSIRDGTATPPPLPRPPSTMSIQCQTRKVIKQYRQLRVRYVRWLVISREHLTTTQVFVISRDF